MLYAIVYDANEANLRHIAIRRVIDVYDKLVGNNNFSICWSREDDEPNCVIDSFALPA